MSITTAPGVAGPYTERVIFTTTSSTDPAIREAQTLLDIEPATHFGTNGGDATSLRAVLSLLDVVDPA